MRSLYVASLSFLGLVAACGGGSSGSPDAGPDAGPPNPGFVPPSMATRANQNKTDIGPANWSCLNTATDDVATTVDINLTGHLTDFQNGNTVSKPTMSAISAFAGIDYMNSVDTSMPTDLNASYSLTLPAGHTRWGFKVTDPDYMDTFLLNQYYVDAMPAPTQDIAAISLGTAAALPALIGLQRTPGTGVLAGAFRDCGDPSANPPRGPAEVSNAVATVSSTSCASTSGATVHMSDCMPTQLDGALTFYIDSGAGIPVKNSQLPATDTNGLFAVLQLPASTSDAYIQVWGFTDATDLAGGSMTLLAELKAPVLGDTVITGSIDPLRH